MNEQQVAEIAEAAFLHYFDGIKVVRVNVWRRLDHDGDPVVDVNVIYDSKGGEDDRLNSGVLSDVYEEIIDKVWRDAKYSPGFPMLHIIAKSEIGRRDPAKAYSGAPPPKGWCPT